MQLRLLAVMPLFYFNVYNDVTTIDEEGQELVKLDAARRVAVKSVREVICDGVREGHVTLSHRIEVENAARQILLTMTFGDVLKISP